MVDTSPTQYSIEAMQIWISLVRMVSELIYRRRHQWVEVSLTRAWSHDTPPRLFDLGD
jgi:hypothetical protein